MINKKNELAFLAGALVVALFIMGLVIHKKYNKPKETVYDVVTKQSQSTEVEDIEKDLEMTDLDEVDKELQDIEQELEKAY